MSKSNGKSGPKRRSELSRAIQFFEEGDLREVRAAKIIVDEVYEARMSVAMGESQPSAAKPVEPAPARARKPRQRKSKLEPAPHDPTVHSTVPFNDPDPGDEDSRAANA